MQLLEVSHVGMTYEGSDGDVVALDDISFVLGSGESLAIIGPSGAGKSTLLQIIDGLLKPTTGSVVIDGQELRAPREHSSLILQDFGLMPWKTVVDNAALGLLIRGIPRKESRQRAMKELERVGLGLVAKSYPAELSGGMQQRLALARSLAISCDLLLMDEPLSALDALLREHLQDVLIELQKDVGYAQIIVTHSIEEAVLLGSRVLVMGENPGRVIEIVDNPHAGSPGYRDSAEAFEVATKLRHLLPLGSQMSAFNNQSKKTFEMNAHV